MSYIGENFKITCFKPGTPLSEWYKKLKKSTSLDNEMQISKARDVYKAITKPLTKPPKSWEV
jgi:hypothetical protein